MPMWTSLVPHPEATPTLGHVRSLLHPAVYLPKGLRKGPDRHRQVQKDFALK